MKNSSESDPAFEPVRSMNGNTERTVLDWPRHAGMIDQLLLAIEIRVRRQRHRRAGAAAACVAAVLVIGLVWLGRRPLPAETVQAPAPNSLLALPTTQILSDGSVVQLREGAEISVAFDESCRRVILKRGEAHFQVTKSSRRPFIVVAGSLEVRAVGTSFGVQLDRKLVGILVTEGRVIVDQEGPNFPVGLQATSATLAVLDAGSRVMIAVESDLHPLLQATEVSQAEIDERLAWRVLRLDFSGTPLDEAIPLFNQYSRTKFSLADPVLGQLRISGLFRTDHPELLLRLLQRDLGMRAERRDGNEIVLYQSR
jgi:transmembrane sensor